MKSIACLGRKEFHHGASRPDSSWMEYYLVNSYCYVVIIRCPMQKRHEWFIIFVQRKQCVQNKPAVLSSRYTWNKNWTFKEYRKKEHWNTGNNTTGNIWCFECRTNTTFTIGRQDGFVNITRSRLSPLWELQSVRTWLDDVIKTRPLPDLALLLVTICMNIFNES